MILKNPAVFELLFKGSFGSDGTECCITLVGWERNCPRQKVVWLCGQKWEDEDCMQASEGKLIDTFIFSTYFVPNAQWQIQNFVIGKVKGYAPP